MDAEGRDLAAAAGDIGQTSSAQAREKARNLAAEKVGREVHQHVAIVHLAVRLHPREYFAADRNALLDDPAPFGLADGPFDHSIPFGSAGFPAKGHPAAAVLVTGFEHQVGPLAADEIE